MVVDKKCMKELKEYYRHSGEKFTRELEQLIHDRLGTEPLPHEYSEQDLREQSRKIVMHYQTPRGRLELLYGLDKLENEVAYLGNKIAFIQDRIDRQLKGGEENTQEFDMDDPDF
jgi:hypothetical protein